MMANLCAINNAPYTKIIERVAHLLPFAQASAQAFFKSHSQFMAATVDITAITPIRAIKHTLAEVERTRAALEEAAFKIRKNDVNIRRLQRSEQSDEFERELATIEVEELRAQNTNLRNSMGGAMRKLSAMLAQYDRLLRNLGKDEITEEDYERDEARYHIMSAMKQALIAARSRGGVIDEGNLTYLFDIGVNGAQAQAEIAAYLQIEESLMKNGKAPTHAMTVEWLRACADKWQHCPRQWAEARGMSLLDTGSLLQRYVNANELDKSID